MNTNSKKIVTIIILAACLVIVGSQNNQVEAADYYVGTFRISGATSYIMTETIRRTSETTYEANLKAVFPSGKVQIIHYYFDNGDDMGNVDFRNSDGNRGSFPYYRYGHKYPVSEKYPIEYKMYEYIVNH